MYIYLPYETSTELWDTLDKRVHVTFQVELDI